MKQLPVYAITLPERQERLQKHLEASGVTAKYFQAFQGNKLHLKTSKPYLRDHDEAYWKVNPPYFITPNHVALNMGWFAIASFLKMEGIKEAIILEDDVVLIDNFWAKFNNLYNSLPNDASMVYLGSCCLADTSRVNDYVVKGRPLCTHAVMLREKAIDVIIEEMECYAPIDIFFYLNCFPKLTNIYVAQPELATQLSAKGLIKSTL